MQICYTNIIQHASPKGVCFILDQLKFLKLTSLTFVLRWLIYLCLLYHGLSTNKVLHTKVYASMANLILQQKCFCTKLALCISSSRHCVQGFVLDGTFAVSWADCEENKNNPFAKEDAEQT